MPKIKCGSLDCKYNNSNNECSYKGIVRLGSSYVHTKNMGIKMFHKCYTYEESEQVKAIKEFMEDKYGDKNI